MKRQVLLLCGFLLAAIASSQTIPELFATAKQQVKAEAWADVLKTLDALEAESAKPGNEAVQKQLEGPLAFYRGVAEANLGQTNEAIADFAAFLKAQPNASIDKAVYSKKAVAAFEKAQKAAESKGSPSLADAYKEFQLPADARQPDPADPRWAEGPVRWILTPQEKKEWSALTDPNARVDFVEKVWGARDAQLRKEFERRVAFADAYLADTAEQPGSAARTAAWSSCSSARRRTPAENPCGSATTPAFRTGCRPWARRTPRTRSGAGRPAEARRRPSRRRSAPGSRARARRPWTRSDNRLEVWHYRKELLPAGVPYQQVDFEFLTKKGYGTNVLQRESQTINTLDAAVSMTPGALASFTPRAQSCASRGCRSESLRRSSSRARPETRRRGRRRSDRSGPESGRPTPRGARGTGSSRSPPHRALQVARRSTNRTRAPNRRHGRARPRSRAAAGCGRSRPYRGEGRPPRAAARALPIRSASSGARGTGCEISTTGTSAPGKRKRSGTQAP